MAGTIYSNDQYSDTGVNGTSLISFYTLTGLTVDITTGTADVTSGSSTYTTYQTIANGSGKTTYSYKGAITFLGKYMAKLSVTDNTGKVYNFSVNLLTGVSTPV